MGSTSSKSKSAPSTPSKSIEMKMRLNNGKDAANCSISDELLLDPRSPHINRTPLTDILGNRITLRNVRELDYFQTPTKILRKKLLSGLGNKYSTNELKLLDPRSPSQFIPRTPLNLSFDENDIENSTEFHSVEYSGLIEEASCRNFNERLANITLDDPDVAVNVSDSKTASKKLDEIEEELDLENYLETSFDAEVITKEAAEKPKLVKLSDPRSPTESICRTPIVVPSKIQFNNDDAEADNLSPIVNSDNDNCNTNKVQAFCSTPTVNNQNGQLKSLLLKAHNNKLNKNKIFEDAAEENNSLIVEDEEKVVNKSAEISVTPLKRRGGAMENEKPRTPLSVVNRRSKSAENLSVRLSRLQNGKENGRSDAIQPKADNENIFFTPQTKSTAAFRQPNRKNVAKIPIFMD